MPSTGRLQGALFTECAEWVWGQLQEEGIQLQGELVELILETERELGVHVEPIDVIADALEEEFQRRGVEARPYPLDARIIRAVLQWEDDFLGFAGISRRES